MIRPLDRHHPLRRPRPRSTARGGTLLAAVLLLAVGSSSAAGTLQGGYEIRRQSESPHMKQVWQLTTRAQAADCAREGIPFTLHGDIATAANAEIIEYHHPGLRRSSKLTRYSEPGTLSRCHVEMRVRQVTTISHYDDKTRTVFTHEIDPRDGPRAWTRTTDAHLDRATVDLLREALSLDTRIPQALRSGKVTIATAPGLAEDRIAGRKCRWVHTPPPLESRSCLLSEGIGMPIDESLSAEDGGVVDGRRIVLIRSKVVRFDGPIAIPASVFEPGESVPLNPPPPNATTRWCEAEAARSGKNPCTSGGDAFDDGDALDDLDDLGDIDDEALEDDGDALVTHFNALIREWCTVEARRSGGTPCKPDGGDLSDPRTRQAMAAWCAEEAARTGINRCERRSHARGK